MYTARIAYLLRVEGFFQAILENSIERFFIPAEGSELRHGSTLCICCHQLQLQT